MDHPTLSKRSALEAAVAAGLEGRRLLEHPFYRRWEAGELSPGELGAYAEQYRHVERALPRVLQRIVAGLAEGPARRLVARSLHDEEHVPEAHAQLFESFAEAAGARPLGEAPAGPAAAALVALQLGGVGHDAVPALAVVAAYEVQAADVAQSKAEGLRAHFGFDAAGTRFWDVHAAMEPEHAGWSIEALEQLGADPAAVTAAVAGGAAAWWSFLDERETLAPAA